MVFAPVQKQRKIKIKGAAYYKLVFLRMNDSNVHKNLGPTIWLLVYYYFLQYNLFYLICLNTEKYILFSKALL